MTDERKPPEQRKRRRRRRTRGPAGAAGGGGEAGQTAQPPTPGRGRGRGGGEDQPRAPSAEGDGGRRRRRRRRRGGEGDERRPRPERGEGRHEREPERERAFAREREPSPAVGAPMDVDEGWDDEPMAAASAAPAAVEADQLASDLQHEAELQIPNEPWGDDSDAPTPEVALAADLPDDPPADDPDPATSLLDDDDPDARFKPGVANVVGIKFHAAGKIYEFDAVDDSYRRGEEVIVETEKGTRVGVVALPSLRRPHKSGKLKRILRRPNAADRATDERNRELARDALTQARAIARKRRLDIKVYGADYTFGATKLLISFSCEKRLDHRELARDLGRDLRTRVEMRQTGVRDEAKMVGGIGSCGRELCCSTFLPGFAPVSIKMAKDQGMVLNPTKVSGQCGRLKCCLVYEQDMYAAMRKGLPKLGKRVVVAERGEGRVTEVDVLRQRIRVSFGPGDFEVFPAEAVEPLFPPQQQGKPRP